MSHNKGGDGGKSDVFTGTEVKLASCIVHWAESCSHFLAVLWMTLLTCTSQFWVMHFIKRKIYIPMQK